MKLKMLCAAGLAATFAGLSAATAETFDNDTVLVPRPIYFQDLDLRNSRDREVLRIRIDREVDKTCAALGRLRPYELRDECLRSQYPIIMGTLPPRVQRAASRT